MAEIILPPIPPRPAPVVRPTMTPTLETPGNKGVKVVMIQGPGTEPGPQPEPPEPPEPPQTTIGAISFLANGVKAPDNLFSILVGSTLNVDCITTGGTATDQTYLWKIRNGDATFVGSTTNKTCSVQVGNVAGMVNLQCDVSSANSTNSPQSSVLGVVVGESMKVANPQAY